MNREERALLLRAACWGGGGLLLLLAVLYAVLWLPFLRPEEGAESRLEAIRRLPARTSAPVEASGEQAEFQWVDREAGIVRIPVEEAMRIQAGRLPVREGAGRIRDERARRRVPTDAGSGRFPKGDGR